MRQRRWLELIKDYDYETLYPPGKANMVADTLSRKERLKMIMSSEELIRYLEKMEIEVKELKDEILDESHSSRHIVEYGHVDIQPDLTYVEQPVRITDQKEQMLRNKVPVEPMWEVDPVDDVMVFERNLTLEPNDPPIDESEDDPPRIPHKRRLNSLPL
ncbi:hypothetical protein AgCh_005172 [Apium graveolens]